MFDVISLLFVECHSYSHIHCVTLASCGVKHLSCSTWEISVFLHLIMLVRNRSKYRDDEISEQLHTHSQMSSVGSYESSEEDRSEDFDVFHSQDLLSSTSSSSLELEDIQEAINGVKRTILETEVSSQARKDLVHKLIRLRIKREDLETRKLFQVAGEEEHLGHAMVPCDNISPARGVLFCGECGHTLWYLIQTVYSCKVSLQTPLRRLSNMSFVSSALFPHGPLSLSQEDATALCRLLPLQS